MSWRTTLGMKPSKQEFAQEVIKLLRQQGIVGDISYEEENFRLIIASCDLHHYLQNHYEEVCRAWPWSRHATSLRFIRSLEIGKPKQATGDWAEVRQRLLPIIRDPLYFETLRLQCIKDKTTLPNVPRRVLGGFFCVSVVIDEEARMAMVNDGQLPGWGITFDQAMDIAIGNLTTGNQGQLERVIPGLYRSPWQDNYDPSRILVSGVIDGLGLRGEPVAMMPNRDCLLIADSLDDKALMKLAELGRAEFDHPRSISAVPLIRNGEVWSPFLGADGAGEGGKALGELSFLGRGQAYADQKQLLDALHEATGKDIFVASCSSLSLKSGGGTRSFCTWTRGVESLLPMTDLIALCDPDRPKSEQFRGLFRWADLMQVADQSFRPVGMTPERWLTCGFPTDEQLASLTSVG